MKHLLTRGIFKYKRNFKLTVIKEIKNVPVYPIEQEHQPQIGGLLNPVHNHITKLNITKIGAKGRKKLFNLCYSSQTN